MHIFTSLQAVASVFVLFIYEVLFNYWMANLEVAKLVVFCAAVPFDVM